MADLKPMLNAYPDSIGGSLRHMMDLLEEYHLQEAVGSFYILPSLYHSDLDRSLGVVDYDLNEDLASLEDLQKLKELGIALKLDFILNHASASSFQFQNLIKNGQISPYADFFINWNEFRRGQGQMSEEGYIQPAKEHLKKMFFRKPGLPLFMVEMPDGTKVPCWNTFYQKVWKEDGQPYL